MVRIIGYDIDAGVEQFGVADEGRIDRHLHLLALTRFDLVGFESDIHSLFRTVDAADQQIRLTFVDDGKRALQRSVAAADAPQVNGSLVSVYHRSVGALLGCELREILAYDGHGLDLHPLGRSGIGSYRHRVGHYAPGLDPVTVKHGRDHESVARRNFGRLHDHIYI